MAYSHSKPEAPKKSSVTQSVESLIQKKKAEKESRLSESVDQKKMGIQEGVAEVMAGVEKPKEKISEREGESGEKGDITGAAGTAASDEAQVIAAQLKDYQFPSELVMIKKIRTAINSQIRAEWAKAKHFQGSLTTGGADGYNTAIAKIRSLKEVLASLFTATMGFLKNLYMTYFTPDGKRRSFEEKE